MSNLEQIEREAAQRDAERVVHTFTVPETLQKYGTKTISIIELSVEDQIFAAKRSGGNEFRIGIESVIRSLWAVDGKKLKLDEEGQDQAFRKLHPKIRDLVGLAYKTVHSITVGESMAFLGSQETTV